MNCLRFRCDVNEMNVISCFTFVCIQCSVTVVFVLGIMGLRVTCYSYLDLNFLHVVINLESKLYVDVGISWNFIFHKLCSYIIFITFHLKLSFL